MDEINIREAEEKDYPQCIELLKETFPGTSNEETFAWRFLSENRNRPILVIAKQGEQLIAFNSYLPWEFEFMENKYLGYQAGEVATRKDFRGKGLFSENIKFTEKLFKERKIDILFGFPSSLSIGPAFGLGYFPIAVFSFYLRIINPFKFMEKRRWDKYKKYNEIMLKEANKITPIVDNRYNKWRFEENTKDYDRIEYVEMNSRAIFYLRKNKWKGIPELILMDCQFSNYNEQFIKNAFYWLDGKYRGKAVYIRTFFNENCERGRVLRKYFTMKMSRKKTILFIGNISKRINDNVLLNFNNWDIMPHCADDL